MTKNTKHLLTAKLLLFLAVLYSLGITYLFFGPTPEIDTTGIPFPDKWVHVTIHLILVYVWLFSFYFRKNIGISAKNVFVVCLLCILYGIIVEVLQPQVNPQRSRDFFDFLANLLGTIVGLLVFQKTKAYFANLLR